MLDVYILLARDLYVVMKISMLEEVSSLLEPVKLLYGVDIDVAVSVR